MTNVGHGEDNAVTDTLSVAERSARMALVRGSGSNAERKLNGILRSALGYRRKLLTNYSQLIGHPDIVVPSLRLVVFVHGCFWHSCPVHGRVPKSREEFWLPKLVANARRDQAVARTLRRSGWAVWTVWEHDLTDSRANATSQRLAARVSRLSLARRAHP